MWKVFLNKSTRILLCAGLTACSLNYVVAAETSISIEQIATQNRASTVYVKADYFDTRTNSLQEGPIGTGFIVTEQGDVVTATHVIKDWLNQSDEKKAQYPLFGKIASKFSSTKVLMTVISADLVSDISIIRFSDPGIQYKPTKICFDGDPKVSIGQPIYGLGFPNDADYSPIIGSYNNITEKGLYNISGSFAPGMSGGALYNGEGTAFGLVEGGVPGSSATNYAIPLRRARSALLDNTLAKSSCAGQQIEPVAVAYTVPSAEAFCSRVKDVISQAASGFLHMKGADEGMGNFSPKILLPSTRWCALNTMPQFGNSKAYMYYSCEFYTGLKDEGEARSRYEGYLKATNVCLGSSWTQGDEEKNDDQSRITRSFNRGSDTTIVTLKASKDDKGNQLIFEVDPH